MDAADPIPELARQVAQGARRSLARAITLIESVRADHRAQAVALLEALPKDRQALRIGLTGTPGVGKSTFIEAFGLMLTEAGLKVAVLAVDPSSTRTGGSILGDKTRMEHLARDPRAFIRASPSQTQLGGIARRSREVVALCEAAGFEVILIETVGVGQSETMVAGISDIFVLLMAPAGGDELQGVKRGIMELADLILVNKADGDLIAAATRTCAEYAGALRLIRPRTGDAPGFPQARLISALTRTGLAEVWQDIQTLAQHRRNAGLWAQNRAAQAQGWFLEEVRHGLLARLETPQAQVALAQLATDVAAGRLTAPLAAAKFLAQGFLARLPLDAAGKSA